MQPQGLGPRWGGEGLDQRPDFGAKGGGFSASVQMVLMPGYYVRMV